MRGRLLIRPWSVARRACLAICLAATAVAGEDRPAGANQLCKQGGFGLAGQKWDDPHVIRGRLHAGASG